MPTKFSEESKRDAVSLVESGTTQKRVCRDLGLSNSVLAARVQEARFKTFGLTLPKDPVERREIRQSLKRICELGFSPQAYCRWVQLPRSKREIADVKLIGVLRELHAGDPEFG